MRAIVLGGHPSSKGPGTVAGFTMIELMVVLVVLAVLLSVGAPAFTDFIRSNRLVAEANSLRASLSTARSEALAQRAFVTVCPSTDGATCASSNEWNTGFISFVDFDGVGDFDGGDDRLVTVEAVERDQLTIRLDNGLERVRFDAQGTALGFSGTFTICDDEALDEDARALVVANSGQIRSAFDTNTPSDGIVNGLGGLNVACP